MFSAICIRFLYLISSGNLSVSNQHSTSVDFTRPTQGTSMGLEISASVLFNRKKLALISYVRKKPNPRSLSTAMKDNYIRPRRYWRDVLRTLRYAFTMRRTLRHWCEVRRRTRLRYLRCTGKTPVYKRINSRQKSSDPTTWQEDHDIKLRHGSILRFSFQFHLRPGFESWYLPQGPSPTPQLMYAQLFEILSDELGIPHDWWATLFRSRKPKRFCKICFDLMGVIRTPDLHEPPLVHCLNQPESSNDKPFAQETKEKILSAVYDCMKRLELETVQGMIVRSGKRSEWVTKGDLSECSVRHPEGDLSGTLPCGHVACMHCEIELAMKADMRHKCGKCEEPFKTIPFDTTVSCQFIESR